MHEIKDISEIRELQMQVLDRIHEFCQQHQLTYFLSSGTLLGAVRHGGYIPWDDDIDIYMPRESFDQFQELFNQKNERYRLINGYNTPRYHYTFPKVVDTHTVLIEDEHPDNAIGIYVDIFPVDYVSDNLEERIRDFKLRDKLKHLLIARQKRVFYTLSPSGILYRIYARATTTRLGLLKKFDKLMRRHCNTSQVCNMSDAGPSIKGCFDSKSISSSVDIKFENRTYKTMIGYKEYLSHTYGDYMQLPPVDKRRRHYFKVFLKDEK